MTLTPAELTVLGLLVEQPRHGYDLEQVIEQRGVRQWTDVAFSSIYYLLTKLEKRGMVEADDASRGGPTSRRVLRATEEGRRAAAEGALTAIADGRSAPQPLLVGLANLALLADDDYRAALATRLAHVETRLAGVRAARATQAAHTALPPAAREVFSYSLHLLETERSWLAARVGGTDG